MQAIAFRMCGGAAGIGGCSTHRVADTDALFAMPWRTDNYGVDRLPLEPVLQRWAYATTPLTKADPASVPRPTPLHLA